MVYKPRFRITRSEVEAVTEQLSVPPVTSKETCGDDPPSTSGPPSTNLSLFSSVKPVCTVVPVATPSSPVMPTSSSPLKRPNFLALKPVNVNANLKRSAAESLPVLPSPETPRGAKPFNQMTINGQAYSHLKGFKVSTRSSYTCLFKTQPMFIPQETECKLSMYSNWQPRPRDPSLVEFGISTNDSRVNNGRKSPQVIYTSATGRGLNTLTVSSPGSNQPISSPVCENKTFLSGIASSSSTTSSHSPPSSSSSSAVGSSSDDGQVTSSSNPSLENEIALSLLDLSKSTAKFQPRIASHGSASSSSSDNDSQGVRRTKAKTRGYSGDVSNSSQGPEEPMEVAAPIDLSVKKPKEVEDYEPSAKRVKLDNGAGSSTGSGVKLHQPWLSPSSPKQKKVETMSSSEIPQPAMTISPPVPTTSNSPSLGNSPNSKFFAGLSAAAATLKPQAEFRQPPQALKSEGKAECNICGKTFARPSQLTLHMNIHYIERPFRCDPCGLSFRTKGHLIKHQRSGSHDCKVYLTEAVGVANQENPRPFKCGDCKIAFRIHGHLAKHLRSKMHIMKMECSGKLPLGIYVEMEKSGISLNEIDTTDCDMSLVSLENVAKRIYGDQWRNRLITPIEEPAA